MPKAPRNTTPKQDRSPEQETPAVYFRSIEVENVLCFKDKQVLNLSTPEGIPAQWTVILGDNGVGKTTLLRCLASLETCKVIDESQPVESAAFYYPGIYADINRLMYPWRKNLTSLILNENGTNQNPVSFKASCSIGIKLQNLYNAPMEPCCEEIGIELTKKDSSVINYSGTKRFKGLLCYGYGAIRKLGNTSLSETFLDENSA